MSTDRAVQGGGSPLRRILKNTAWLLGGKGFGAVCGLAYLAILTRSLGLKDFGHFALIFGTAQALIAITGFETWRAVVRYGAEHVHRGDWVRFGRLGLFCGVVDAVSASVGCLIAFVLIYGFGDRLDLNPAYVDMSFAFCCAMVWALVSAPTGIVRALHRFDVAVYVEAVVPLGRLLSAALIWWTGPSVGRFLLAWAVIDLVEAALYWTAARRLRPEAVRLSHLGEWRLTLAENPRLLNFLLVTCGAGAVGAVMRYGPLLAVGGLVGTRAAGLYRLASQLAQALGKLSTLLTRAVYAEVAHARASGGASAFRRLTVQTSLLAGAAGALVVGIALSVGADILALVGGRDFERGGSILVPLTIAASFELASVAFEPVLHTAGRAGDALAARLVGVAALGASILALVGHGAVGVAWAAALGAGGSYVALGLMAFAALRREPQVADNARPA